MKNIEKFIYDELKTLSQCSPAKFDDVGAEIYRLVMHNKFRKYSANDELKAHIKNAIDYNVKNNLPINVTFLGGSFKLWRLKESPEVDWAELFSLMYYTNWVKSICAIYKPGVHFDFFQDDIIMEKISNYTRAEIGTYIASFQKLIDFVKKFCPKNLKFTITPVSSIFKNEKDFFNKLSIAVEKWAQPKDIKLSPAQIATLELNYRPVKGIDHTKIPLWREENTRVHDAYIKMSERQGYRNAPNKIAALSYHLGATNVLMLGSTKNSTVKYWVGVGALQTRGDTFMPTVLSLGQLEKHKTQISTEDITIKGLDGKNFKRIRVLKS